MEYINLIVKINQTILAKKKYFYHNLNKKNEPFIKKLILLNILSACEKLNTKQAKLTVFYKNENRFFKKIKLMYKLSAPFYIKWKTLIKIKNFKHNSLYLLLTNKGCLTNHEAIKFKIGGILLCKFKI